MRNDVSKLCACFLLDNWKYWSSSNRRRPKRKRINSRLKFSNCSSARLKQQDESTSLEKVFYFCSYFFLENFLQQSFMMFEQLNFQHILFLFCALIGWRWAGAGKTAWGLAAPPACSPPASAGGWCAAPAGRAGCWGSRKPRRPAAGWAPRAGCWQHASPSLRGGRRGRGLVRSEQGVGFVSWKRLQVFILNKQQQLTSPTYLNALTTTTTRPAATRQEFSIQTPLLWAGVTELDSFCRIIFCLRETTRLTISLSLLHIYTNFLFCIKYLF